GCRVQRVAGKRDSGAVNARRSIFDDNTQRSPGPQNTVKMVSAKKHIPIVKKHRKTFKRHQSDRFKCVPESWRKPKGIDSCVRRRFRGTIRMPKIGYGSNKATRHMMPNGFKAFVVKNTKDVELLLMHNRTYAAEIAHAVSSQKRVAIIAKAKALGVKVTNPKGRLTTEN
ncbi:DNA-binding protein SMUBP-2, partial [Ascosphaera pollenicola]